MREISTARFMGFTAAPTERSMASTMMLAGSASTTNATASIISIGPPSMAAAPTKPPISTNTSSCSTTMSKPLPVNATDTAGGFRWPSAVWLITA